MKIDLTKGDIQKHIIRMSIPMAWGIFAIMTMNIVDTYFVAQLGTKQLATMGFIFPVVMVLHALTWGIAGGATSVISRALGAKNSDKARNYATQALILVFCVGIVFATIGVMTVDIFFPLLGAGAELLPYIHSYIDVWYMGCFLVMVPMVGNSIMRSNGNSKFPSSMMILMAILNMILDPIMIFGLFGFPEMGLKGAAVATIASYSIGFFASIYVLAFKMHIISWFHCFDKVWEPWKGILHVGIPSTCTQLISPLGIMVTTWMVSGYGTESVAGYGVATRIVSLLFIFLYAMTSVIGPIVGQNFGAGKTKRVVEVVFLSHVFSVVWGVLSVAILWFFGNAVIVLFDDNLEVISSASLLLHIVPLSYVFLGFAMVTSSVANAIGKPKVSLLLAFARLLVVYIPLALLFNNIWGLKGIYMGQVLSNIIVGIAALLWSRKTCMTANEKINNNIIKV